MTNTAESCSLADKTCVPCSGGVPTLKPEEIDDLKPQLSGQWHVVDNHHLKRGYDLNDFKSALDLTNRIGAIAEQEGHHPDIFLAWGKVELTIFTHAVDGLTESDFVLAAKIDKLSPEVSAQRSACAF